MSSVIAFFCGVAIIICSASYTIRRDYQTTLNLWQSQLSAAAQYHSWTLLTSLQQSKDDTQVLADFSATRDLLHARATGIHGIERPGASTFSRKHVADLLTAYKNAYEYAALYLFDTEGRDIVNVTDSGRWNSVIEKADTSQLIRSAAHDGQYAVRLFKGPDRELFLAFVMPVFAADIARHSPSAERSPIGVVAILDPFSQELSPMLHAKNIVTRTGKTMLLQLHDGKYRYEFPGSPGFGESGETHPELDTLLGAASLAANDKTLFGRFIDERGVAVMAALQRIPAINSVVVYKVDVDESFGDLYRLARLKSITAIALILAYATIILLQRRNTAAREMRMMLAREQLLSETLENKVAERTSQLAQVNQQLSFELGEREKAQNVIREMNAGLELRVRQRTMEVESANKELAAFAYSLSHDLRAPLRAIDGFTTALVEDYGAHLESGAQQYLTRVRKATFHMTEMIEGMLVLARAGSHELTVKQVDLTGLAYSITARVREGQPQRSIQFDIAPELEAKGDRRLLEIALTNLFDNAVKYTAKVCPAIIEFGKIEDKGKTAFYVRDNGAGFNMTYASKLFGAFQRLHKESDFPGIGIGLATFQRVVTRHGGRVWAEGRVNEGATFWFTLELFS